MTRLSSLKVSVALTASALTIPSRMRSWMMRSSRAVAWALSPATLSSVREAPRRPAPATAPALATVPPRDQCAEDDVEQPEAGSHREGEPAGGQEQRQAAGEQEGQAHAQDDT